MNLFLLTKIFKSLPLEFRNFEMPKKKFQLALISIISFGFILILILNLGVVGNQCTNLTGLIEAHQAEEQVKVWWIFWLFNFYMNFKL